MGADEAGEGGVKTMKDFKDSIVVNPTHQCLICGQLYSLRADDFRVPELTDSCSKICANTTSGRELILKNDEESEAVRSAIEARAARRVNG